VRTPINNLFCPYENYEKRKNLSSFFLFYVSYEDECCARLYLLFFPPNLTWHNSFFYKIWGEIGNKLGGKDINESVVIYLEKKSKQRLIK
jgi:hypothetical protein